MTRIGSEAEKQHSLMDNTGIQREDHELRLMIKVAIAKDMKIHLKSVNHFYLVMMVDCSYIIQFFQ